MMSALLNLAHFCVVHRLDETAAVLLMCLQGRMSIIGPRPHAVCA